MTPALDPVVYEQASIVGRDGLLLDSQDLPDASVVGLRYNLTLLARKQVALLANSSKAHAERVGYRAAEDEAARLDPADLGDIYGTPWRGHSGHYLGEGDCVIEDAPDIRVAAIPLEAA